jgi:hypothetical protein
LRRLRLRRRLRRRFCLRHRLHLRRTPTAPRELIRVTHCVTGLATTAATANNSAVAAASAATAAAALLPVALRLVLKLYPELAQKEVCRVLLLHPFPRVAQRRNQQLEACLRGGGLVLLLLLPLARAPLVQLLPMNRRLLLRQTPARFPGLGRLHCRRLRHLRIRIRSAHLHLHFRLLPACAVGEQAQPVRQIHHVLADLLACVAAHRLDRRRRRRLGRKRRVSVTLALDLAPLHQVIVAERAIAVAVRFVRRVHRRHSAH